MPADVPNMATPNDEGGTGTGSGQVDSGTAGRSAQREYERRRAQRDSRIRDAHPRLGGVILALTDEPQSTSAWARGARGEEVLGRRLDALADHGVRLLHDRRIPRTRANIDHIAVGPSGVVVIDAKRYRGRPALRVEGGLLRPRTSRLMVGSRDCTTLVQGVHRQTALVRGALERAGLADIPVHAMLCFVDADWPLIGGAFVIEGVDVLWPKKAIERLVSPGPIAASRIDETHRTLAMTFPVA
ncbi:nuclease-related domain-containing protein [Cellulomonas sp.]|uniref:nuclease-related domain-containing protein n=1 Tax=Cellulomonas sp. TaxID=40001 RepID=UPI0025C41249|nr:nuclease-related domain-containing protein [Cellulomonas sp.]